MGAAKAAAAGPRPEPAAAGPRPEPAAAGPRPGPGATGPRPEPGATALRSARDSVGIDGERFRAIGHELVDRIGHFFDAMHEGPIYTATPGDELRRLLGQRPLPPDGADAGDLVARAAGLCLENSVLVGHGRFWGYVHGAASPLGALADLLASALNSPVTSPRTGPISSAIEEQTVRWVAELVGFPAGGGLFLSGGSMANFVALRAALHARLPWNVRELGMIHPRAAAVRFYATGQTHTSVAKALALLGLGTRALVEVATDAAGRMDPDALERRLRLDRDQGLEPLAVVGTAGTTSTGAVDPLPALAALCREQGLWLHVDGAYGAPACLSPLAPPEILGLREADSLVVDAHKWLYQPLEAGCVLVRDPRLLYDAFCFQSDYYSLSGAKASDEPLPLRDQGPQTSRGFRALKVWLALQHLGRGGYAARVTEDIELARHLYALAERHPELEACSLGLSIATFRYVPRELAPDAEKHRAYLDELNREILARLQDSGAAYPSHTTVKDAYVLRVCVVNFNTTRDDIESLPPLVAELGAAIHAERRALAAGGAPSQ
ncbi:MAG TPA: pyridoxal-dependent decarboxylase [Polyangiaceae bacterium]|nr:pyridoxal-dependent decarboxylase [Polyangiaceae bacterium]